MKVCSVEGCNGKHKAHGYCSRHYQQWKKYGYIKYEERYLCNHEEQCKIKGCKNKPEEKLDGYCQKHYKQLKSEGLLKEKRWNNIYYNKEDFILLIISKNEERYEILIDIDDYDKINQYSWCISHDGYIVGHLENKKQVKLHRYIMNCPDELVVDHINHNKLDNRKSNLRVATVQENSMNQRKPKNNTSGYKNIRKVDNRYEISVMVNGKRYYEYALTLEQAIKTRDEMLDRLHKEFQCKD